MKKNLFFLIDEQDVYYKMLTEAISDELEELNFGYIKNIKDIFRADYIVVCGSSGISKNLVLAINIIRKPLILYHVLPDSTIFNKLAKRAKWVVSATNVNGCDYFPSPVLLSDIATQRQIERIWGRERLASKRGSIGIIGIKSEEEQRQKLVIALDLLVEDLDLNIVSIPILKEESEKDILGSIKYSANTRFVQSNKYSSKELLGIISRLDILVTTDEKGVVCAMAVGKPVVGLSIDDELDQLLTGMAEEDILFDIDKLKGDELYSKLKIAWVHRDTIAKQMQKKVADLKKKAGEGIRRLEKEIG